jgi:hypothetical protein
VTELEKLAPEPLVPPAVVLDSEPLDQRGDLGADRAVGLSGSDTSTSG